MPKTEIRLNTSDNKHRFKIRPQNNIKEARQCVCINSFVRHAHISVNLFGTTLLINYMYKSGSPYKQMCKDMHSLVSPTTVKLCMLTRLSIFYSHDIN